MGSISESRGGATLRRMDKSPKSQGARVGTVSRAVTRGGAIRLVAALVLALGVGSGGCDEDGEPMVTLEDCLSACCEGRYTCRQAVSVALEGEACVEGSLVCQNECLSAAGEPLLSKAVC